MSGESPKQYGEITFREWRETEGIRGGMAVISLADSVFPLLPLGFKLNQKDSQIQEKYLYTVKRIKEGNTEKAKFRFKIDLADFHN